MTDSRFHWNGCLYLGDRSCPNCGRWLYAKDPDTGIAGPFAGPNGVLCWPEECWEELEALAARAARRREAVWCPECGYDNHEHCP